MEKNTGLENVQDVSTGGPVEEVPPAVVSGVRMDYRLWLTQKQIGYLIDLILQMYDGNISKAHSLDRELIAILHRMEGTYNVTATDDGQPRGCDGQSPASAG